MASKYFKKALSEVNEASKIFVDKNLDITEQVYDILDKQGKSQKDLAKALGKTEPEISRLLSGLHNFTLKTIAKLEAALGEAIITTPKKASRQEITNPVFSFSKKSDSQSTSFSFDSGLSDSSIYGEFKEAKIVSIRPINEEKSSQTEAI